MRKIVFASALLLSATPAFADPSQDDVVSAQLQRADEAIRENFGSFSVVTTLRGNLDDGQQRGDIVRITSDGAYVVVGVCDQDCDDFDLVVNDTDGDEVGADRENDDLPIVAFGASGGDVFQIQSVMASCSADPCATGVRIYRVQ